MTSTNGRSPIFFMALLFMQRFPVPGFTDRQVEHLGEVQGTPAGRLGDLLATAEAVGDDQRFGRRLAHGGQQGALTALHGYPVMLLLEPEGARHTADRKSTRLNSS